MLIVLFEDEPDDAWVPALQAARTPPAPVASAPAPIPLSTDRRRRPSSRGCPPAPLPGPISSPLDLMPGGFGGGPTAVTVPRRPPLARSAQAAPSQCIMNSGSLLCSSH